MIDLLDPPCRERPRLDTLLVRPRSSYAARIRANADRPPAQPTNPPSLLETVPMVQPSASSAPAPLALVAEDHPSLRELTALFLRREGFRVIAAEDGQAALEAAAGEPIDLLVTDVHMPRMGGLELAERILSSRPQTAVLLTSGEAPPQATRHAFLPKPFSSAQLLARLRPLVGERLSG